MHEVTVTICVATICAATIFVATICVPTSEHPLFNMKELALPHLETRAHVFVANSRHTLKVRFVMLALT